MTTKPSKSTVGIVGLGLWGSGYGARVMGFEIRGSGYGVRVMGLGIWGSGYRVRVVGLGLGLGLVDSVTAENLKYSK